MEDYFEEFDDDADPAETDEEYEFEASQFYDFTRPESDHEIEEAERWFQVSGDYPSSPFIVKLNLEKLLSVEVVPTPSKSRSYRSNKSSISSSSDINGAKSNPKGKSYKMPQAAKAKVRTSSAGDKLAQPRSCPSFMEPTASNLAKQKHANHNHSVDHICARFQKISAKAEQIKVPPGVDINNPATKRQKLDIGYSKKVSHLKHQFLLMHKSTNKVTTPKEPELETMIRAQRRRSKASTASTETESQKQKICSFKAHPLNKKILQPRLSPQPKKSQPRLTEFQEFHLKTKERANHHASAKIHPDMNKEGNRKSAILKETGSSTVESLPTEQFSKLSLGPGKKSNTTSSQSSRRSSSSVKSQKTADCDPLQADTRRCNAKPKQCGGHVMLHEAKCWSDMSRSLDIH